MIWFFEREGLHLYYEVRLCQEGPGYELVISYPDGILLTERYDTEADLNRRFRELEASLAREGWGPMEKRESDDRVH